MVVGIFVDQIFVLIEKICIMLIAFFSSIYLQKDKLIRLYPVISQCACNRGWAGGGGVTGEDFPLDIRWAFNRRLAGLIFAILQHNDKTEILVFLIGCLFFWDRFERNASENLVKNS